LEVDYEYSYRMKKISMLIVDDHALIRKSLAKLISRKFTNLSFQEATTGEEALKQLEGGIKTDLILMDVSMPGMGGIEACRLINEGYPGNKVVMLTLNEEQPYIDQAMSYGACAYVNKIEKNDKLFTVIREQLATSVVS
jgi:DNA-binding NarL/FixJ family response regulator